MHLAHRGRGETFVGEALVELVQLEGGDLPGRHVPEGRTDPLVDQPLILAQGGRGATLAGDLLQPLGEQRVDRAARFRRPATALQLFDELRKDLSAESTSESSPAYLGHRRLTWGTDQFIRHGEGTGESASL